MPFQLFELLATLDDPAVLQPSSGNLHHLREWVADLELLAPDLHGNRPPFWIGGGVAHQRPDVFQRRIDVGLRAVGGDGAILSESDWSTAPVHGFAQRVAAAGNRVTIAGKVIGPLAARSKDRIITLQRVVACKKAETVRTFAPAKSGSFSVTVDAPAGQKAAVYRLSTRVRRNKRANGLTTTFTLPRAVDFG